MSLTETGFDTKKHWIRVGVVIAIYLAIGFLNQLGMEIIREEQSFSPYQDAVVYLLGSLDWRIAAIAILMIMIWSNLVGVRKLLSESKQDTE